uniref:DNA-directed DNA polymerase n=1 Tax=Homalodisca liturata TaxID=320908 RepID=A0A1B6I4V7_9HEMI
MIFCKRCFAHYSGIDKQVKLNAHKLNCKINKPLKAQMPDNPSILKFTNFHFKFKVPVVAYCDFECILKKVDEQQSKYTTINEIHEPMSFCVYLVIDKDFPEHMTSQLPNEPYLYRGPDAASKFMDYLISIANLLAELIDINRPMIPLTDYERNRIKSINNCELCNLEFTMIEQPVKDHCHFTGRFRNLLCNKCNLKRKNQTCLPIFLHGSSNYDTHFIVKQLGCDQQKINVIPNSSEKYVSFSKNTTGKIKLRFLDSFRFLNTSLAQLANNLPKERFYHTKLFFNNENDLPFVTRKGVYPYEYTDSWEKLEETQLPAKECFFNKMSEEHISNEEFDHAKKVWSRFNCQTLGDYSDFYLKTDVLLLADIFENFRIICLNNYELDPANYLTLPSLTFDAMQKFTEVELELLNNYDMYMFIEKGIRGGITSCIKRHAIANNKDLNDTLFDCNKPSNYLTYIDANNLYGWAMIKPMPKDGFRWLTNKEIKRFNVQSITNDSPIGYIIECNIGYPSYLHDYHNDLPFLPEKQCPPNSKQVKLLTTLNDKEYYVCHYVNLKQALDNGLVLKRIHRILQFNQSPWLKSYILFNTEKRKQSNNEFEKDFYKLLNNAMFGKSIENVRDRLNLELVNTEKRLSKLISRPNFKNRIVYSENLSAVECSKDVVLFNKPIYIGFTVLELSKFHMYDFHYNIMKPFYSNKINLLYIDTDSFFYEIFTKDLYEDFNNLSIKKYFDMSDYPKNHKCYFVENKKKLGCFKDECMGIPIVEFIGLRSKLYTYRTMNDLYLEEKKMKLKKAKGVTKSVIKNHINFYDYKNCLFSSCNIRKEMRMFQSKKHTLRTVTINKLALNGNDDKRCIQKDGVHTLAYGHTKLKI